MAKKPLFSTKIDSTLSWISLVSTRGDLSRKAINLIPLFGNSWDPESDAPSSSADESALIRHTLSNLDSSIQAPEAYASVRALIALKRYTYANQRIKEFASILEKLLIWCFFIRRLSPSALDPEDLENFFSICRQPPKE
ncbi:hypothetical protein, partial [Pseudomonas monteilii]|uniref:hypothetical protein n=1 Tax=Pseudomonas monteilii TaxID=76759 RepID=UPI001E37DB1B